MSRPNTVTKTFSLGAATWTAPAGVYSVQTVARNTTGLSSVLSATVAGGRVLDPMGNAYTWGDNGNGQLGVGDLLNRSSPVAVVGGLKFSQITMGNAHTIALDLLGNAWGWGDGGSGQLADGSGSTNITSPVPAIGGLKFSQLVAGGFANTFGIDFSGNAWAWGQNTDGELGVGDTVNRSSPVAVVGGLKFSQIVAQGSSSCYALDLEGNAYAWGQNGNGQLGVGDIAPRSSPVAILGGLKFSQITSAIFGAFAIDLSGNAWAWGKNTSGELGIGIVSSGASSPVAVVGGLKFSRITTSLGPLGNVDSVYALDFSGNAYAWGGNNRGQLGDGTIVNRSSPVAVVGGLKFSAISGNQDANTGGCVYALDSSGVPYAWGYNGLNQLGVGDSLNHSSPVAVVGGLRFNILARPQSTTVPVVPGTTYQIAVGLFLTTFGQTVVGKMANQLTVMYDQ